MPVSDQPWLWTRPLTSSAIGRPVAQIVRQYRQTAGLTQAELATLLHLDQSYVSKIESGRRQVRDLGLLVSIATVLRIPAAELGLSGDLVRVTGASGPRPAVDDGPWTPIGPDLGVAVAADQDRWRATRRYLNQHRHELAQEAVGLYPNATRIGSTPLISLPSWLPGRPVELSRIELEWHDGAVPLLVSGAEPEASRTCPLRVPGRRYERYTSAVRYLESPTLFENRPAYRLLDVSWSRDAGRMRFALATYFDKLDLSEAVGHEHARLAMANARRGEPGGVSWPDLPLRALVADPFDCARRAVIPAVTTLMIRVDPGDRPPGFLLHWRDPAKVATAGGLYDVIPAGEFQPSSVAAWDRTNDFDLWRNIVRELSEELLGAPEHDGSRGTPIDYESWPLYRALRRACQERRLYVGCLGVGLDALTLAATILTVIVVDGSTFDDLFGEIVHANAEGFTVSAGHGHRVADGIAFTEENVRRLLTREPVASPGAACLYLAWQHRDLLTKVVPGGTTRPRAGPAPAMLMEPGVESPGP